MRRALALAAAFCASIGATASVAAAAVPEGPRVAFVEWTAKKKTGEFAVISTDASGGLRQRIAGGNFSPSTIEEAPFAYRPAGATRLMPMPILPSWSGDGSEIIFTAWLVRPKPKRKRFDWPSRAFIAPAEGGGHRAVRGPRSSGLPLFLPDGKVVFIRGRAAAGHPHSHHGEYSLWTERLDRSELRRVTPWRYGVIDYPSSVSPDGTSVAVTRVDERREFEVGLTPTSAVAVPLNGDPERVLAANAVDPAYSPDGTRIAFARSLGNGLVDRESSIFVAASDGSAARRVTSGADAEDSSPSWDPSGARLAFARETHPRHGRPRLSIEQINGDGSCERVLHSDPRAVLLDVPVWQPGPGRGAGPIVC